MTMKFSELAAQVKAWLQNQERVSYRALQREFEIDDDYLADLKTELIDAQRVAVDEGGKVLVWIGEGVNDDTAGEKGKRGKGEKEDKSLGSSVQLLVSKDQSSASSPQTLDTRLSDSRPDAAERRQLTVMFCDLVGSTALSERLDPEEYRELIQAYNEVCAAAIKRFDGHLAKYMGDGLLVYFGYPVAHEDDAQRAVRTGLAIVLAIQELAPPTLPKEVKEIQVRIGIHTGLVIAGEMGAGDTREPLAIVGETPNLAARLQALAEPNTVFISAATHRLVRGYIACRSLGPQMLKGLSIPVNVYEVQNESGIQSRFDLAVTTGLTPLVGRTEELALLEKRWEQVKNGEGQVVLLCGEAG
jgi:class 3 adenylate cyclase